MTEGTKEVVEDVPGADRPRLADSFTIYSLYQAARPGLANEYVDAARRFVTGLTAAENGEDGPGLWGLILENLIEQLFDEKREKAAPRDGLRVSSLYDTHLLSERAAVKVIGAVTVFKDDRGWGRKYGLEGVWIGGLNVLPEYRGIGLGANLFYYVVEQLNLLAGGMEEPVRVNLFTRSPTVRRMAEGHGFSFNEGLDLEAEGAGTRHYHREYGIRRPRR